MSVRLFLILMINSESSNVRIVVPGAIHKKQRPVGCGWAARSPTVK